MFLRGFEGWHIVIIVALLAILFGARRMPAAARSIGQSLRIFKSEIKAAKDDDPQPGTAASTPAPAPIEQQRARPEAPRVEQHRSSQEQF